MVDGSDARVTSVTQERPEHLPYSPSLQAAVELVCTVSGLAPLRRLGSWALGVGSDPVLTPTQLPVQCMELWDRFLGALALQVG